MIALYIGLILEEFSKSVQFLSLALPKLIGKYRKVVPSMYCVILILCLIIVVLLPSQVMLNYLYFGVFST